MDLGYAFIPEQLIQANIEIQSLHRKELEYRAADCVEETSQLLKRLDEVPRDMARAAAMTLTDREVDMLAGYLPYNYLELDERHYFDILQYRMNDRSAQVLFSQWQESFDNSECNSYLKNLTSQNRPFQEYLLKHHIQAAVFLRVLASLNIPLCFDEELVGKDFANGAEFNEKLKSFGVIEESFLDIECKRALLTFCGRTDYFSCSQENLLDIIRTYDGFMLRKFVLNFLHKLMISELQVYPALAEYLRSVIGHRRSKTFQEFFDGVHPDIVQKYIDWINLYKINAYFANDDRSRFWKQYRYLNVIRYPVSNTVILEFDRYVAVEFLGEEKGTIYLCDKEVFKNEFYPQLEAMDNHDLRIYFKVHKDKCVEYRNHTGRWQSHIKNVISKKEMAEKIRI